MEVSRKTEKEFNNNNGIVLDQTIECHNIKQGKISSEPSSTLFQQFHHGPYIRNLRSKRCRNRSLSLRQRQTNISLLKCSTIISPITTHSHNLTQRLIYCNNTYFIIRFCSCIYFDVV